MVKIDFPFPKEILARKRAEKEDTKAASVAKATETAQLLIPTPFHLIELSHKPSNLTEQPPTKKQNVGEKPRKKALMKKKEQVEANVLMLSKEP